MTQTVRINTDINHWRTNKSIFIARVVFVYLSYVSGASFDDLITLALIRMVGRRLDA